MMLLMMHLPHLHQPWRLDRCNPFMLELLRHTVANGSLPLLQSVCTSPCIHKRGTHITTFHFSRLATQRLSASYFNTVEHPISTDEKSGRQAACNG